MMQSLNIYVSLLNLNFGKLKIAGTGTINLAGEVGEIGGAAQKIHTANRAKVDMYFIALGNHKEVKNIEKTSSIIRLKTSKRQLKFYKKKLSIKKVLNFRKFIFTKHRGEII